MANPLIQQGSLNKVRAQVVVPGFSNLTIISSYMGTDGLTAETEDFCDQIGTATGTVPSPNPYAFASITIHILKTNGMVTRWWNQKDTNSQIGKITIHSDTDAFDSFDVQECVIKSLSPGKLNGTDATSILTLRGVLYINNDMWSAI